jgi:hypothetical protein
MKNLTDRPSNLKQFDAKRVPAGAFFWSLDFPSESFYTVCADEAGTARMPGGWDAGKL